MNKKIFAILVFLLIQLIVIAQSRVQFPPIKSNTSDTSLTKFIDTLDAIVERKDFKKICTLVNTNFLNGFDSELDRIKKFKIFWGPDKGNNLWMVLTKLLAFGGQYSTIYETHKKDMNQFVFPYFFDEQITGEENYFDL